MVKLTGRVVYVPCAAEDAVILRADQMPSSSHLSRDQAHGAKYAAALRAIIARADNNEPGTSKVQDMKRIAVEALKP